jgi:hypothetical protein
MSVSKKLAKLLDINEEETYTPYNIIGLILGKGYLYEKEYIEYIKQNKTDERVNYLKMVEKNNIENESDHLYKN